MRHLYSFCLKLLNIHTCIFPFPTSVYSSNTFYVADLLIRKGVFLSSADILWRYIYISVSLCQAHRERKHHLFISGEIEKPQAWPASKYPQKASSKGKLWCCSDCLSMPRASPLHPLWLWPRALASSMLFADPSCIAVHNCSSLFYPERSVHSLLFLPCLFPLSFHITYWFAGSLICFEWGETHLEKARKTNQSS